MSYDPQQLFQKQQDALQARKISDKLDPSSPSSSRRDIPGSQHQHAPQPPKQPLSKKEQLLLEARDFVELFHNELNLGEAEKEKRWQTISTEIEQTGTYVQTPEELNYGAKVAWRNSSRCINRLQWKKLMVMDKRHLTTAEQVFEAACEHVKLAFNGGAVRSVITVFDHRPGMRIWNSQYFRYAGYQQPDGTVIGDPANLQFTKICMRLGWVPPHKRRQLQLSDNNAFITPLGGSSLGKPESLQSLFTVKNAGSRAGSGTRLSALPTQPLQQQQSQQQQQWQYEQDPRFEVLPLIVQEWAGAAPKWFEWPAEIAHQVRIRHRDHAFFEQLGLRWFALPAISNMSLCVGGLQYSCVPFNGWFMGTEIGGRNLTDPHRYNQLPVVAKMMGLDTSTNSSLWKDHAYLAMNEAVLYSFQRERVTIIDHHTATEGFMQHFDNEMKIRGHVPADWIWLVPPVSGGITPVFHQEMLNYHIRPNYEYQPDPWLDYAWPSTHLLQLQNRPRTNGSVSNTARKGRNQPLSTVSGSGRGSIVGPNGAPLMGVMGVMSGNANAKMSSPMLLLAPDDGPVSSRRSASVSLADRSHVMRHRLRQAFITVKVLSRAYRFMVHQRPPVTVVYATESGHARTYAQLLARTLGRTLNPTLVCLEDYDLSTQLAAESTVLFVVATYGNGNAPAQGEAAETAFVQLAELGNRPGTAIERKGSNALALATMPLNHLLPQRIRGAFSVFALGSRAYKRFCGFGQLVDDSLATLGGQRLLPLACGDELSGQAAAFMTWKKQIVTAVNKHLKVPVAESINTRDILVPFYTFEYDDTLALMTPRKDRGAFDRKHPFSAVLVTNRAVTSNITASNQDGGRVVRHAVFKLPPMSRRHESLMYKLGDHIGVFCHNDASVVNDLLAIWGVDEQQRDMPVTATRLRLQSRSPAPALRMVNALGAITQEDDDEDDVLPLSFADRLPSTLSTILSEFVDVTTPLFPSTLAVLAAYAQRGVADVIAARAQTAGNQSAQPPKDTLVAPVPRHVRRASSEKPPAVVLKQPSASPTLRKPPTPVPRMPNEVKTTNDGLPDVVALRLEADKLAQLAKGEAEYNRWRAGLPTLLDTLRAFPITAQLCPMEHILQLLPPLQPRLYSVASSPDWRPNEVHIAYSVLSYQTPTGPRRGVCSSFLEQLPPQSRVDIFVRPSSSFSLPLDTSRPVIMIGAGSGIAPFRGFWQQTLATIATASNDGAPPSVSRTTLASGLEHKRLNVYIPTDHPTSAATAPASANLNLSSPDTGGTSTSASSPGSAASSDSSSPALSPAVPEDTIAPLAQRKSLVASVTRQASTVARSRSSNPSLPGQLAQEADEIASTLAQTKTLMQHRSTSARPPHQMFLFYGTQTAGTFPFRDEITQLENAGLLTLHTAFSRERSGRIHVTARLLEQGEMLWQLLSQRKAHVYVCGSLAVASSVEQALSSIVQSHGRLSNAQAEAFLSSLRADSRYQEDIFGSFAASSSQ